MYDMVCMIHTDGKQPIFICEYVLIPVDAPALCANEKKGLDSKEKKYAKTHDCSRQFNNTCRFAFGSFFSSPRTKQLTKRMNVLMVFLPHGQKRLVYENRINRNLCNGNNMLNASHVNCMDETIEVLSIFLCVDEWSKKQTAASWIMDVSITNGR